MSEQPVAAPPRPKPPGKQYLGLSRNQWFLVGGVFVAAVGYLLWRRHQAAKTSSTTASTSASTAALTALEDELAQLQGAGFGASGGGSGGGYGGYAGTVPAPSTTAATPAGTPVSLSGAVSSTTTATTAAAPATSTTPKAGAISNLQSGNVTTTTARISWNPTTNASQGYAYKVTQLNGVVVKSGNTSSTSVSLSGLHPGFTYNFGVQGLPGGPGDNIHFTTKSA